MKLLQFAGEEEAGALKISFSPVPIAEPDAGFRENVVMGTSA
jgi:hypothetical protein